MKSTPPHRSTPPRTPSSTGSSRSPSARPRSNRHSPQAPQRYEPVDPRWILKAFAAIVLLSVLCGYITLCVVYARSAWQLVLAPSRTLSATPTSVGLAFQPVRFAADDAGQPQLDGWWIPASSAPVTALLLHSGTGSMSDALPQALALHNAGLNVLLFDYRGFGHSSGQHPTQRSMQQDAHLALDYLLHTRALPASSIVPYGIGVGAPLALELTSTTSAPQPLPALILDHPIGDLEPAAAADPRSSLVPARLLFRDGFPLADPLARLTTPKLILTTDADPSRALLHAAANPKMLVTLPPNAQYDLTRDLRRFLDAYLPGHAPTTLTPSPAPPPAPPPASPPLKP